MCSIMCAPTHSLTASVKAQAGVVMLRPELQQHADTWLFALNHAFHHVCPDCTHPGSCLCRCVDEYSQGERDPSVEVHTGCQTRARHMHVCPKVSGNVWQLHIPPPVDWPGQLGRGGDAAAQHTCRCSKVRCGGREVGGRCRSAVHPPR